MIHRSWKAFRIAALERLRRPWTTLAALLVLVVGLGSSLAVGTILHAVLVESVPFAEADRLVFLRESTAQSKTRWVAWDNYRDWSERQKVFTGMAAHAHFGVTLSGFEPPENAVAVYTTANLLDLLGTQVAQGRFFTAEDDRPNAAPVVVLSHGFYESRFGGKNVLGERLEVGDETFEIVGVTPPGFLYPRDFRNVDFYLPLGLLTEEWGRSSESHPGLSVTARLRSGVGLEAARNDIEGIAANLAEEHPETNRGHGIYMVTVRERLVGNLTAPLTSLGGAALAVLLLTIAGLAHLEMVRVVEGSDALRLRHALGAPVFQLALFQLVSTLLLALLGGALSLLLASALLQGAQTLVNVDGLPAFGALTLAENTPFWALGLALLAGLLSGALPAVAAARQAKRPPGTGTRSAASRERQRLRRLLVSAQLALALALSLGAALAGSSFLALIQTDAGFEPGTVQTFNLALPDGEAYDNTEARRAFYDQLMERLAAAPNIAGVALTAPLLRGWSMPYVAAGQESEEKQVAEMMRVSQDYFNVLGIDILRGNATDLRAGDSTIAVGERFAETVWPGENAIGQRLRLNMDPEDSWRRVVAVVDHVKNRGVHQDSRPQIYVPWGEDPGHWAFGAVLPRQDSIHANDLAVLVAQLEPQAVVDSVQPVARKVAAYYNGPRLLAACLSFFAIATLLIAIAGVYGVVAAVVAGRQQEMGVRLAMGACPADLRRLVVGEGLKLGAVGLLGGVLLALVGSRFVSQQLYGVEVFEPWIWLPVPALLLATVLIAGLPSAWHAGRTDPAGLLRGSE